MRLLILLKSIRFGAAAIVITYLALSLASFSSLSSFAPTYTQILCIIALVIVMIYARVQIEKIAKRAELKEVDLHFLKLLKDYNSQAVEKGSSKLKSIERVLKIIDFVLLATFCISVISSSIGEYNIPYFPISFVYGTGASISVLYILLVIAVLIGSVIFESIEKISYSKIFRNAILVRYILIRNVHFVIQLYIVCLLIEPAYYWQLSERDIQTFLFDTFIVYVFTVFIRSRIYSIEASLGISAIDNTKIFYPVLFIKYDFVNDAKITDSLGSGKKHGVQSEKNKSMHDYDFEFVNDVLKMLAVVAIPIIIFSILQQYGIAESAATYIGLPWLLAILFALSPKAKSASGLAFKGTTMVLLLGAPIFGAGYICIFFMFPLFYLIGYIIAKPIFDARNGKGKFKTAFISVVVGFMALEGTTEFTSFPREHEVEVSKVVAGSLADVRATLEQTPTLDNNRSFLLKIWG